MSDVLPWLGVLSPIVVAVIGWWTYRTVGTLNHALQAQAIEEAGLADVTTEEAWQRLYRQTVEELERTTTRIDSVVSSRDNCEEQLAVVQAKVEEAEDEITLLRAEVIRLGGDPRNLRRR